MGSAGGRFVLFCFAPSSGVLTVWMDDSDGGGVLIFAPFSAFRPKVGIVWPCPLCDGVW